MKIATLNFHRHFLVLLAILFWHSPLGAQDVDEGEFYLNFSGSAIFPYDPRGQLDNTALKAGTGFTAAFGYAFKEGFSTEMEWGYQKVGIDQPPETFFQGIPSRRINVGGIAGPEDFLFPSRSIADITFKIDGEIKTQSLMGNVYYRYPKWRVSPYAGVGFGAFFHDRTVTSTITVENIGQPFLESFPPLAARGRSTFSELRWYPPMEAAKGSLSWVFRAKQPESVRTGP